MRQRCCVGFPILAVELVDGDIKVHPLVETSPRHGIPVLVGARDVEAFNPTRLAKTVFRTASIERVLAQVLSASQKPKPG